jgi:hypothetical protein
VAKDNDEGVTLCIGSGVVPRSAKSACRIRQGTRILSSTTNLESHAPQSAQCLPLRIEREDEHSSAAPGDVSKITHTELSIDAHVTAKNSLFFLFSFSTDAS